MSLSTESTGWFRQRNLLGPTPTSPPHELPREVEIYLLVTLARRPDSLPPELAAYVATRFFGSPTGGTAES